MQIAEGVLTIPSTLKCGARTASASSRYAAIKFYCNYRPTVRLGFIIAFGYSRISSAFSRWSKTTWKIVQEHVEVFEKYRGYAKLKLREVYRLGA